MKDLKPMAIIDRAKSRVAKRTTNEAVRQSQEYFHDLLETAGKLIFLCTYRLLMASVRGLYAGISTFFKEMGR